VSRRLARPDFARGLESGSKITTEVGLPAPSSAFFTPVAMPQVPTAQQKR
jgi:hypothetical protein